MFKLVRPLLSLETRILCPPVRSDAVALRKSFISNDAQSGAQTDHIHPGQEDIPIWLEDHLKVAVEQNSPKETYISTIQVKEEAPRTELKPCVLCRLNLPNLNYTDVKVLSQFIKKNGKVRTYHESRLCSSQYKKITKLIEQAQRCNLIARPADYFVPGQWHDLNTYLERDRKRDQPRKLIKPEYWKI